ncbi:hypothetical protein V5799_017048 [Amblyomma americanum]|uniref:WAP domain-containing protein n=1 Tax=Amblyomma americanum TaxID=6943 RepID=A0AAQ4F469_AMBAM
MRRLSSADVATRPPPSSINRCGARRLSSHVHFTADSNRFVPPAPSTKAAAVLFRSRASMKFVFVCAVVIFLTAEQCLGTDTKERSKRDTTEKGTSPDCPSAIGKPGTVCAFYMTTQTCADIDCESQGKICCRDSCGHLECIAHP